MKRLLLLVGTLLFFPVLSFAQTATVTGHALFPNNAAPGNATVCFSLLGFKPNIPRVSGTGVIVKQTNFCINVSTVDGSFSTVLFENTFITPSTTTWRVDYLWNNVQQSSATYLINSTPFNLDTQTPISQAVTVGPNQLLTQSFVCSQPSAVTTWTCIHNFSDSNVLFEIYDLTGKRIFPDLAVVTNTNTVTFSWVVAQAGIAVIMHAGSIAIATNQPNAVLQNPTGAQTIGGSFPLNISAPLGGTVTFIGQAQISQGATFTSCTPLGQSDPTFPIHSAANFPLGPNLNLYSCGPADLFDVNLNLAATTTTTSLSIGSNTNIVVGSTSTFASNTIGNTLTVGRETANEEVVGSGNWAIVDATHINVTCAKTHAGTTTIEQGPGAAVHQYANQVFQSPAPAGLVSRGAPVRMADKAGDVVLWWPSNGADPWPFGGLGIGVPVTGIANGSVPATPTNLVFRNSSSSFGTIFQSSSGATVASVTDTAATFTGALNANGGGALVGTFSGAQVLSGSQTVGKWNGNCIVDGVANATLAAAVTCAGSSGVIEIPMFAVPTITGNVTIPAGVTLRFDGPSGINTTGFTLTINGSLQAPSTQIFFGTGTVVLGANASSWVNPIWFPGATADVQINNAVTAMTTGGSVNAQWYGPSSQTIAATVNVGSNAGSGKTVTMYVDRTTTFTCTITNNTPCLQVNAGSTVIGFGMVANPNAGFLLSGTTAVSNIILQVGKLGVFARGATGATVSDSLCAVRDTDQLTQWMNTSCAAGGTTNTVGLKVYATSAAGNGITNPIFHNVQIDMGGLAGNRPVWVGCASPGSLTPVACGQVYAVNFIGGLATHPGTGGLPIVTLEGSNGAGGQNQVDSISFIGYQIESSNAGDIGILVDGAFGVNVNGLVASSVVAGADLIRISQPAGTTADGITMTGLVNQGAWTNTINNTIITKTITNAQCSNGCNYRYTKNFSATNSNVWDDGSGNQATIDTNGITATRGFSAIGNGKGLQLFNTATTCTTAASIGAICTTAAITLPVAYADTNYRLSCTGQTPTNVPIVQTYAKSNTTFTITIAALTAAAATFVNYDCSAVHN
jgi:hypothetical protein